jgi:hypothetical protein
MRLLRGLGSGRPAGDEASRGRVGARGMTLKEMRCDMTVEFDRSNKESEAR